MANILNVSISIEMSRFSCILCYREKDMRMPRIIRDVTFIEDLLKKNEHEEIRKDEYARIFAHYGEFSIKDSRFILELIIEILEVVIAYKFPFAVRGYGTIKRVFTKGGRLVTPPKGRKPGVARDGEKVFFTLSDNIKDATK